MIANSFKPGLCPSTTQGTRPLTHYGALSQTYPPLVVFNDMKNKYYKALGTYDKTGSIEEFMEYVKESLEETWKVKRDP